MNSLSAIVVTWPLAISMAVVTVQGVRTGRRRAALNRALHEVRRPLQAVALAAHAHSLSPAAIESSVQLAALALEELEREINGTAPSRGYHRPAAPVTTGGAVAVRPLLESAAARWEARARRDGGSLALRWKAGSALVAADARRLSQAIDNLIVNAIEHGGPDVVLEAQCRGGRLRIAVADPGCAAGDRARHGEPNLINRLAGRRRHGHGLVVVREVAAAYGGRFALSRSSDGSVAMLELPLAAGRAEITA